MKQFGAIDLLTAYVRIFLKSIIPSLGQNLYFTHIIMGESQLWFSQQYKLQTLDNVNIIPNEVPCQNSTLADDWL